MGQQIAGVQRAPLPIRPQGPIGDDQMGVQQRVARPGGAVREPHRQQALALHMLGPMPPGARADLLVKVGDRRANARLMRGRHLPRRLRVPQAIQDRHVLMRAEHQVPGGHGIGAGGAAELLAGAGIAPGEQVLEGLRRTLPVQAQRAGAATMEHPRGLALAGQVLLAVAGDLAGVVARPAGRQLVEIRNHAPSRPPATRPGRRESHPAGEPAGRRTPASPGSGPTPHRSRRGPSAAS
jgi:hypothetical protein